MRPFHFAILFWGRRYCEFYFIDKWLRSMMAPTNLPILKARDGHKIVVATTEADWDWMNTHPLVNEAKKHITWQWIEIDDPHIVEDDRNRTKAILHQHKWFGELLRKTHDRNAYGSVFSPDQIVSRAFVARMFQWADRGIDCAICIALRQAEEPLLAELGDNRDLPVREAASLSVRHLHREIEAFIEPMHAKMTHAPYRLWPMPSGYLIHGFFGLPVFMDYSVVSSDYRDGNIDTCLRTGNFAKCKNVHIINDSDEMSVLSLTPQEYKNYPEFSDEPWSRYDNLSNIRTAWKFFGDDHVRQKMFRTPVRWHYEDIGPEWLEREEAIERDVQSVIDNNWLNWFRFDMEKTPLGQQAKWWATYAPKRVIQKVLG